MCNVGPIEAVDAIGSEHSLLLLQHALFLVSFGDVVAEFVLDVADFFHQVVESVEIVAVRFRVEVKPYVLYILIYELPVAAWRLLINFFLLIFLVCVGFYKLEHLGQTAH